MYYLSFMQLLEYYNFDKTKYTHIIIIELVICIILIMIGQHTKEK